MASMYPYLIDSHAHLNFNAYQNDGPEVIRRSLAKNIWLINVGSQCDTSRRAVEIASQYSEGVYAAIGLHPIHLQETYVDEEEISFKSREEKFDPVKYQDLIDCDKKNKIVAVGEIGLDYYHLKSIKALKHENIKATQKIKQAQQEQLLMQLNFAHKNNLPVILHCRGSRENPHDAYEDILKIMSNIQYPISGVLHCFGADLSLAQKFIDLGFYIGFTGIITFGKSAEPLRQVVKNIPLEKILIETDCPYLAPEPHRSERNEPCFVQFVAEKIAAIKNITLDEVSEVTVKNTMRLFNLK